MENGAGKGKGKQTQIDSEEGLSQEQDNNGASKDNKDTVTVRASSQEHRDTGGHTIIQLPYIRQPMYQELLPKKAKKKREKKEKGLANILQGAAGAADR